MVGKNEGFSVIKRAHDNMTYSWVSRDVIISYVDFIWGNGFSLYASTLCLAANVQFREIFSLQYSIIINTF